MKIDYVEIGRRIARRRKELGLKQYEVCELIDVNYKYISNIETGRSAPSLETVMNLCEALQTTPDSLLMGAATPEYNLPDRRLAEKINMLDLKGKQLLSGIVDLLNDYLK